MQQGSIRGSKPEMSDSCTESVYDYSHTPADADISKSGIGAALEQFTCSPNIGILMRIDAPMVPVLSLHPVPASVPHSRDSVFF